MSSLKLTEQQLREFLFQTFSREFENKSVQENKKNIKIKNTNRHHTLLKENPDPPLPQIPSEKVIKSTSDNAPDELTQDFLKTLNYSGKDKLSGDFNAIQSIAQQSAPIKKSSLSKEKIGAMILAQVTKEHSEGLGWNPDASFLDFLLKETFTKNELGLKTNEQLDAEEYILRGVDNSAEVDVLTQFKNLQAVIDAATIALEPGWIVYQKAVNKTPITKMKPTNLMLVLMDAAVSVASAINRASRTGKLKIANQGGDKTKQYVKSYQYDSIMNPNSKKTTTYFESDEIAGTLDDIIWWEEKFYWLDLFGAVPLIGSLFGTLGVALRKKGFLGVQGKTAIKTPQFIRYSDNGKTVIQKFADFETNFFKSSQTFQNAKKAAEGAGFEFIDESDVLDSGLNDVKVLLESNPSIKQLINGGFDEGHAVILYYSNPEMFQNLDKLNLKPADIYEFFNTLLLNNDETSINKYFDDHPEFKTLANIELRKVSKSFDDNYDELNEIEKKNLFFKVVLEKSSQDSVDTTAEASFLKTDIIPTLKKTAKTNAEHLNEVLKNATDEAFTTILLASVKNNAVLSLAGASINSEVVELISKLGDDQFIKLFDEIFPQFDKISIDNIDEFTKQLDVLENILTPLGLGKQQKVIQDTRAKINNIKQELNVLQAQINDIPKISSKISDLNKLISNDIVTNISSILQKIPYDKNNIAEISNLEREFLDLFTKNANNFSDDIVINKFDSINEISYTVIKKSEMRKKITELFTQLKTARSGPDDMSVVNAKNGLNNIWYTLTNGTDEKQKFLDAQSSLDKVKDAKVKELKKNLDALKSTHQQLAQKLNVQRPRQNEFFSKQVSDISPKKSPYDSGKDLSPARTVGTAGPQQKYYDLNDPVQKRRYELDKKLWESLDHDNANGKFKDDEVRENFITFYIQKITNKNIESSLDTNIKTTSQKLKDLKNTESQNKQEIQNVQEEFTAAVKEKKDAIEKIINEKGNEDARELFEVLALVEKGRGAEYLFRRANYNFVSRLDQIRTNISNATQNKYNGKDVSSQLYGYYSKNAQEVADQNNKQATASVADLLSSEKDDKVVEKTKSEGKKTLATARTTAETEKYLRYIMNGYIQIDEKQAVDFLKLMKAHLSLNINSILLVLNPDTVKTKEYIEKMLTGDATLELMDETKIQKLLKDINADETLKSTGDLANSGVDELINKVPEFMTTINEKMLLNDVAATNYLEKWRLTKGVWKTTSEQLSVAINGLNAIQKQVKDDLALINNDLQILQHASQQQGRIEVLNATKKCYEELLKNVNMCFEELSDSVAGNAGLDILGNLNKYTQTSNKTNQKINTEPFQREALNKKSVISDFLLESTNPAAMQFKKNIGFFVAIYNLFARLRTSLDATFFQKLGLFSKVVTEYGGDAAGFNTLKTKFDDIPEFIDCVNPQGGAGVDFFIEKLKNFREALKVAEVPEKAGKIAKIWGTVKKVCEYLLVTLPLMPLNLFIKHPTWVFIAFKAVAYMSLFSGAGSIFVTQTLLLFTIKLLSTMFAGAGFKFLMWCITHKSKNLVQVAKSFVTDILSFTNKLFKISLRVSSAHAKVRTDADELQELEDLENSWSPTGIANQLLFKAASGLTPAAKGSTVKEFFVQDIASRATLPDDIKNTIDNMTPEQRKNAEEHLNAEQLTAYEKSSLKILETEYARDFQNNFDRFLSLFVNKTEQEITKAEQGITKTAQQGKMSTSSGSRDQRLLLKNLSTNAINKLKTSYVNFKNSLDLTSTPSVNLEGDLSPVLYYFYLTDLLKETSTNTPSVRNYFITHNFYADTARLTVYTNVINQNEEKNKLIQIQQNASIFFSNVSVAADGVKNDITDINKINDFFLKAGLIHNDVTGENFMQKASDDISLYDCQIIMKFLHDIQVQKKNLINLRKKTDFNKEGHLNFEAMLTGGLYKVTFGKTKQDRLSIQSASINQNYLPKEYEYTETVEIVNDSGQKISKDVTRKTSLSYLRQFSKSAPNSLATQLSEDIWITQWQPKNNSFITGVLPDYNTITTIKEGLLSFIKLYGRVITAVTSKGDIEFDPVYLATGNPPTNFVNRYTALDFLKSNRNSDNSASTFSTEEALKQHLNSKKMAGEINDDIIDLIISLWNEEKQQKYITMHDQELSRLESLNKEGFLDDWNVKSISKGDGAADYIGEGFKHQLQIKDGKKLIVEAPPYFNKIGGMSPHRFREVGELEKLKALDAPYKKIKMNELAFDLSHFNTVRKGILTSGDTSNKESFNKDLNRSNDEMNNKDPVKNLEKNFAEYKQRLQNEINNRDSEAGVILQELEQFRNYTVQEIMDNPGLIKAMHENTMKQLDRLDEDLYKKEFDIKQYEKINEIKRFYLTNITPRIKATEFLVQDYKENIEKLKIAVQKAKGTEIQTLMNNINELSIAISKQGICLGKPRNNETLQQILSSDKFKNSDLNLHDKLSLFKNDITKLFLCMQQKEEMKVNLTDIDKNLDTLSINLKNSQSNLLFAVITKAIKAINENSVEMLKGLSSVPKFYNLAPIYYLNVNNQEKNTAEFIQNFDSMNVKSFFDLEFSIKESGKNVNEETKKIITDYGNTAFAAINYNFLKEKLPRNIPNGKSVKEIYSSIFVEMESIQAEVDTNQNPLIEKFGVEKITKNYIDMILKPVFGNSLSDNDFILESKKDKNDSIIGFYYNQESMSLNLEKIKESLNTHDYEQLKEAIESGAFFINRIIYSSKAGMKDISFAQDNEYLNKLEYIYEVDISPFYFASFSKQKQISNNTNNERQQKIYEYYGIPYLDDNSFIVNKVNNVVDIVDPSDNKAKKFDASHLVFKYKETCPFNIYSYEQLRQRLLQIIIDKKPQQPLKTLSFKEFKSKFNL